MTATVPIQAEQPSALQAWVAAARPRTLPATLAPIVLGFALAIKDGVENWMVVAVAALSAGLIQIGTNFANDYFDFVKGADTAERVGAPRATQQGWITPNTMAKATGLTFALAFIAGLYLVWVGGYAILILGLISIACGVWYTGGPYALAYIGLGDIFVFIFFGPVAVCATYYLQSGTLGWPIFWLSVPVGLLMTAIIVVNNHRDRPQDEKVGKRTLAVRFGDRFSTYEYASLIFGAYTTVGLLALYYQKPFWLLCWVTLGTAYKCFLAFRRRQGPELNPLLGATAQLGLRFSIGLAVGVML